MKAEVVSTEYKDGARTETVVYTYTMQDDIQKLAQLCYSLGKKEADGAALKKLIDAQNEIIRKYGEANAPENADG
jgi:hypothetical protein